MRQAEIKQCSNNILLVDNNLGDVELTCEALTNSTIPKRVHVVRDGEEAMSYLKREGNYKEAARPDLILLDINMPRKNGMEVLAELKQNEKLRDIPVIMLTSSNAERDIAESYVLQVNAYVVKPNSYAQLQQMVKLLEDFWLGAASLPSQPKRQVH